jgi:DNA-binding LacI/PurR family transcriptional regulator
MRLMIGRRIAGLAVVVSEMDPYLIDELTESSIPVVFHDMGTTRQNITNVCVNYRDVIETIVRYLHSGVCRSRVNRSGKEEIANLKGNCRNLKCTM